jgi:hypothetical protein
LIKESQDTVFNERWKLYVPMESLDGMLDKGVGDYDAMG